MYAAQGRPDRRSLVGGHPTGSDVQFELRDQMRTKATKKLIEWEETKKERKEKVCKKPS